MHIPRDLYSALRAHLDKKEITVLLGPRQSGKTTLMKKLCLLLEKNGMSYAYYNLDIATHKRIVQDQTAFINHLTATYGDSRSVIFIDEIQKIENPGIFLKGIYDSDLPYKLIVSGSSTLEIKAKIHESLTGRKRAFYLYPLSFSEFVRYKKPRIQTLRSIPEEYQRTYESLLDEYIRYGGYPSVAVSQTSEDKIAVLHELYTSYIERDVKGFFKVTNETAFTMLVSLLAGQLGSLTNVNMIAANTKSTRSTIDNFLYYLEESFVTKTIRPFFSNPEKELIKQPKIYFVDTGLRNIISQNTSSFFERPDKGVLFENFVMRSILNELTPVDKLYHWRSKLKAEVDFVVQHGLEIIPIEVKAMNLKKPKYTRSFRSFINKYEPKKAFVVNLSLEKTEKIGKTIVHTVPFYKHLF